MNKIVSLLLCVIAMMLSLPCAGQAPRIVNIVNFVRQNDYRIPHSEESLYDATIRELALVKERNMPATFLLQYDALISPPYVRLMKEDLPKNCEVGAWWELTQPQVEAAGLKWKAAHPWDPYSPVCFSTGYTPEEREKLVDAYMKKFHDTFGYYPHSVGSWFMDAHTLAYMVDKYQITVSCNCKDQIGTDGYTLWGGYWNQAYYPSRRNAYMPAQTKEGQIDVPIFRMLGSDPIYQYAFGIGGNGQDVATLEPISKAGENRAWVENFMQSLTEEPCLAFAYAQAGQENSFTWTKMGKGMLMQIPIIDSLWRAGKLSLQTMETTGKWFREKYPVTPATAVTVLEDVKNEGRQTVWYNSRYYRSNILVEKDHFRIRDIHLFDESFASDYIDKPSTSSKTFFFTLPVVDGNRWASSKEPSGMFVVNSKTGEELHFGDLDVKELTDETLQATASGANGQKLQITMSEKQMEVKLLSPRSAAWALEIRAAAGAELPFRKVVGRTLQSEFRGHGYELPLLKGRYQFSPEKKLLRIQPSSGVVKFDMSRG